jgi:small subunit ribosomal protein S6
MMIHRPDLAEPDVRSHIEEVEKTIDETGTVRNTDFWGKRRFAYEIEHLNEGFYSVVDFEADPDLVDRMDRALGLLDSVLRHKILRWEA